MAKFSKAFLAKVSLNVLGFVLLTGLAPITAGATSPDSPVTEDYPLHLPGKMLSKDILHDAVKRAQSGLKKAKGTVGVPAHAKVSERKDGSLKPSQPKEHKQKHRFHPGDRDLPSAAEIAN